MFRCVDVGWKELMNVSCRHFVSDIAQCMAVTMADDHVGHSAPLGLRMDSWQAPVQWFCDYFERFGDD